jgi:hypothetical protein
LDEAGKRDHIILEEHNLYHRHGKETKANARGSLT